MTAREKNSLKQELQAFIEDGLNEHIDKFQG